METHAELVSRRGKRPGHQAVGTRDPAGAIEGRTSQRLDRVHGGERAGLSASCALVRRVGDRQFRPGRTSSPVRPVSVSLPHDDRVVGSDLLGAIGPGEPESALAASRHKRSHPDLNIALLAEREMTAVLQLLQDIAGHLEVRTTVTPEQLRDLKKTDLRQLTNRM